MAHREISARAILQGDEVPGRRGALILLGVIADDEGACAPHHEQSHHLPPVVGMRAGLKGTERGRRRVRILEAELGLPLLTQQHLGTHANVLLLWEKQS